MMERPGERRPEQAADRRRREKQPNGPGSAAEMGGRQRGEQRPRHAENHCVEVHQKRHRNHRLVPHPPQPLGDRGEPGARAAAVRWHGAQPGNGVERASERRRVDGVGGLEAGGRDDDAGEQRSDCARELKRHLSEGGRRWHPVRPEQSRDERHPSRLVDRKEAGLQRDQQVEQPELSKIHRGLDGERDREECESRTGDQHELAPVERVGERTSEQADHDHRHGDREPDRADREGGVRHFVDLHRHGDGGDLIADPRQRPAGPQPAVFG